MASWNLIDSWWGAQSARTQFKSSKLFFDLEILCMNCQNKEENKKKIEYD